MNRELTDSAHVAEESSPAKKRQKRGAEDGAEIQQSKKGTACSTCRKLKVKCDSADRDMGSCSRCLRLRLKCVSEKKVWMAAENVETRPQPYNVNLIKLERALEDVLEKLNLPALDLYAPPEIVEPSQSSRPTRQNSPEPGISSSRPQERDISPGPTIGMGSLIEATRLDGLCSQLRSSKQRRKGGMRRMESDLISEMILTYEEADEMLELFKTLLSPHLFSATIPQDATLETIRTSSTILFTAIMLVSALHISGHEYLHERCHSRFLGLVTSAIFDRFHTLDDIRGLCIAALWQPDLSWKLSGLCIRMATELNLHHAFYEAFYSPDANEDTCRENLEKARLWYLLFVLDHQSSIAYGRPPVMAELRPIKDFEVLLNSPWCTPSDQALIAQVTGLVIMSKAFQNFGLEPKRTMGGDDASVLNHFRFTEDSRVWKDRWSHLRIINILGGGIDLHYYFSELVLHSLVLRGRPLETLHDLPTSLRPLTLRAIEAAHLLLQHFIEEPGYREGIVGMPLYMHSMIAFAVVFLMKMSRRWQKIGITIDPVQRTRPLIEGIIKLLRDCKAGASHMVFSMANGFERMLKQTSPKSRKRMTDRTPRAKHPAWPNRSSDEQREFPEIPIYALGHHPIDTGIQVDKSPEYNIQLTPDVSPYNNWGFQDEELWSLGMGYDLLAPGGEGLANADFPFFLYEEMQQNS
ncbi:hypothetical protein N7509_005047 [Penicillium cosmopolitanum]|uniref:Zn(2)-C6 fungal-type domain-containing protein n=1 Tax=Penicillium cosmopolitanum TaxID=1131564 RepID=A0A9X0B9Q5_9EURO|nr:uncharacterized protein N7509_005047 [Penicillium cosmopolitanum]KAJ5396934.1 hypothetical protein N7509_005047 [Penicillium cosmopolitanum]